MVKLLAALTGVVLLISGAVLGAAAVQQPFFDFLQLPGLESTALQMVEMADCEALPEPGVNWRGCDKSGSALQGPDHKLAGAMLVNANLSGSYFNGVDMTNSSIDGLDLSDSTLFLVNFKGARGIPTGDNVDLFIFTCPGGSAKANYSGDVSAACDWQPAGGPQEPMGTPRATRESPQGEAPTATAIHTPDSAPPTLCWEGIVNGGFEVTEAWRFQETTHPATYSQEQVHGGAWALRAGISDASSDNVAGFSSARQTITIPGDVSAAMLSFYLYPQTSEAAHYAIPESEMEAMRSRSADLGDAQWVTINDENGQELEPLLSMRSNTMAWDYLEFNLIGYAGRTIEIYFGVYNNGSDGITAMYVDDVSLTSCPGQMPPESPSPATPEGGPIPATPPVDTPTPVATQDNPTNTATPEATPTPVAGQDSPLSISGRLVDGQGAGVAGIVVGLSTGETAMTDGQGYYSFNDLEPGAYTIFSPPPYDLVYEPPSRMVDIPPPAVDQSFVGSTATPEAQP